MNTIRNTILGLLSVLLVSLSTLSYGAITLGPYLQNATTTSMTIHWRSSKAGVGRVTYGLNKNDLNKSADETGAQTKKHIVTITGLQANTKYFYRVGNGVVQEIPTKADQQYFYTNPTTATPTRIWVLGDAGTGRQGQKDVLNAYYNYTGTTRTNLVLALGDNAYGSGTDSQYVSRFFRQYEAMFVHTPVWSTQGNHERDQRVYTDVFTHPTNGEGGGVASGTELYYSFDYGDIHFICLNSYKTKYININPGAPQYQWLERDLRMNTKPWVIAFWHHPPYSITSGHNSDREAGMKLLRENANKILEQYGVDVVFGGHNHSYNRSYFINDHYGKSTTFLPKHKVRDGDGSTTPYQKTGNRGTVYVMTGSAGKVGYSIDSHPANVSHLFTLGSFVVDINGNTLKGTFLRETGAVDDSFTIVKNISNNQQPTASFTSTAQNLALSFTDTSQDTDGTIAQWKWNFGDNTASTEQHPTHTYAAAGTYTVSLTVLDNEGASGTKKQTIIVANRNQEPVANFIYNTNNLEASFSDRSRDTDGSIIRWAWSFGDSNTSNQSSPKHTYTTNGTYTVSLTVTDNKGASNTKTQLVTVSRVNQPPISDFTYNRNNLTVNFNDQSRDTDGAVQQWLWQFGDGRTSTIQNPTHTYAQSGNYTVRLKVTDNTGATHSTTKQFTVNSINDVPKASFTMEIQGMLVNFIDSSSDTDGSIVSWKWDFGDNGISTQQKPSHQYAAAGSYPVELTVTDNLGAVNTTRQTVTVAENLLPIPEFSYTVDDMQVNFSDKSKDIDGSISQWQWQMGDGSIYTVANPKHIYASEGNYTVVLTVTDNENASKNISKKVALNNKKEGGGGSIDWALLIMIIVIRMNYRNIWRQQ